jgi:hypothetical protein
MRAMIWPLYMKYNSPTPNLYELSREKQMFFSVSIDIYEASDTFTILTCKNTNRLFYDVI